MKRTKQCSEAFLDLLAMELVRTYTEREDGPPAAAALEAVGVRVGRQLIERMILDRPRFADHLEVIKFVCKEFWAEVFQKQIDNLKTNHRGVFVLQDNRFRWLLRLAPDAAGQNKAQGALCILGVNCTVTADAEHLPVCSFTALLLSDAMALSKNCAHIHWQHHDHSPQASTLTSSGNNFAADNALGMRLANARAEQSDGVTPADKPHT